MRQRLGDKLPKLSEKDKELLSNAIDFVGLNHYTSRFISHVQKPRGIHFYQVQEMERIGTCASHNVFALQLFSSSRFLLVFFNLHSNYCNNSLRYCIYKRILLWLITNHLNSIHYQLDSIFLTLYSSYIKLIPLVIFYWLHASFAAKWNSGEVIGDKVRTNSTHHQSPLFLSLCLHISNLKMLQLQLANFTNNEQDSYNLLESYQLTKYLSTTRLHLSGFT